MPLVASVGVVEIAVGLGAQKLIQDFVLLTYRGVLVSSIPVSALAKDDYLSGFHTAWRLMSFIILVSGMAMLTLFRKPTEK